MALSTIKFTELPFHRPFIPLCSRFRSRLLSSSSSPSPSSARIADQNPTPNPRTSRRSKPTSAPWLGQWDPPQPPSSPAPEKPKPSTSIERIVHRLRTLELGSEEEEELNRLNPLKGDERLGELMERSWNRPDQSPASVPLPWEREEGFADAGEKETGRRKRVKAPTLAELTIEDEELRRLRREGMTLRERISIPKAGVTKEILEKIHDFWRRSELVRLKFHEDLAHDMKTAHEIVEVRDSWKRFGCNFGFQSY